MTKQMVCDYSNDIHTLYQKYKITRKGDVKSIMYKCENCGSNFVKNSMNPLGHFKSKKCQKHGLIRPLQTSKECMMDLLKRQKIQMIYYSNSDYKINRIVYINDRELEKKYNKKYTKAVKTITNWYMDKKYDPQYKACRDRVDKLYEEDYNSI